MSAIGHLFGILFSLLLLSGCAAYLALPISVPTWLVVSFIFINRPVLKWLWNILTAIVVYPILCVSTSVFAGIADLVKPEVPRDWVFKNQMAATISMVGVIGLLTIIWGLPNIKNTVVTRTLAFGLGLIGSILMLLSFLLVTKAIHPF